jgi:isopenicillin N synthase-like dioxygenase
MPQLSVPIIDIGPYWTGGDAGKRDVAAAVDRACRDIGFLVISGHGIAPEMVDETREGRARLFRSAARGEIARRAACPNVSRGYTRLGSEAVARSRGASAAVGDLNETLIIGPVDPVDPAYATAPTAGQHFAANLWPERPAELRPVLTRYYRAVSELAQTLMRIFALGLGLDESFFDDKIDRSISRLRIRNYPAQTTKPLPGQLRAGAHSDYGSLTILAAEDKPGGLQVCNATGDWVDVPVIPGCFIVNLGDLMARWTNDAWVSTLHRVVNPPEGPARKAGGCRWCSFTTPITTRPSPAFRPASNRATRQNTIRRHQGEHLRRLFVATQMTAPQPG